MTLHKKALCIMSLGLLLGSSSLPAADKSAKKIVRHAYAYIGSLDQYTFDAVVVNTDVVNGEQKSYTHETAVKIDRPGDLRVDSTGAKRNRTITLHDGLFTMYDRKFGYFGQLRMPDNIDNVLDLLVDKYGIKAPLSTLIYSDMDKRLKFKQSKYFGIRKVAGVACDYVVFKTNHKAIHLWITTGAEPLVKVYTIIEGDSRIDTSLTWDTHPKLSENDFVVDIPKNVSRISIQRAN